MRREFLAEVNRVRTSADLEPVTPSENLTRAAQARADDIAAAGNYDSVGVPGENLLGRARRYEYAAVAISQIIGQGEDPPAALLVSWSQDSDVGPDLVNPRHKDLGVGVAWLDELPLYVLFLGVTAPDDFARSTAALRDPARVRRELLAAVNREREAERALPPAGEPDSGARRAGSRRRHARPRLLRTRIARAHHGPAPHARGRLRGRQRGREPRQGPALRRRGHGGLDGQPGAPQEHPESDVHPGGLRHRAGENAGGRRGPVGAGLRARRAPERVREPARSAPRRR